jgi:hypothetical protein
VPATTIACTSAKVGAVLKYCISDDEEGEDEAAEDENVVEILTCDAHDGVNVTGMWNVRVQGAGVSYTMHTACV